MNRMIIVVTVITCMVSAIFAVPHKTAATRSNDQSIARERPSLPEPPHIMDDTLQSWNFTAPQGWSFTDASDLDPQWHPDTVPGLGSDSAWWCGNYQFLGYGNYWYQVIQTPMLDLSATTSPTLACKLLYSFEPVGTSAYDGVTMWISTNGGNTWAVLTNPTPAYSATSLNAASAQVWNLGTVPGYSGVSGGAYPGSYQITTANLTNFRQDSVIVRWSVLSDRAISAETRGLNSWGIDSLFGCFLDSVRITDGATNIFSDNGGHRGTNTLQTPRTHGFGQHWEWNSTSYSSSPTSAHCLDGFPNQQSCLVSPFITLPLRSVYFRFSVKCDMPDSFTTNSRQIRHGFLVEVQGPDSVWQYQFMDRSRTPFITSWYDYGPSDPPDTDYNFVYGQNQDLNLSQWAGQSIRIRFKAFNDYAATPSGTGLWIDDVRLMGDNRTLYDIEPTEFRIPFPTTPGQSPVDTCILHIVNLGRAQMSNVNWSLRLDSTWIPQNPIAVWPVNGDLGDTFTVPLTPPRTLHPAISVTMPTTPPITKTYFLDDIAVRAPGLYEMGYDRRHWWTTDTLPAGLSYAEKFNPTTDGYYFSNGYHVHAINFATRGGGAGSLHVKLMTASGAIGSQIGVTLFDTVVTVTAAPDTVTVWHNIDISAAPESRNQTGIRYVVLQRNGSANMPLLAADSSSIYGSTHAYNWAGGTATPVQSAHDLPIRMIVEWPNTSVPEPLSATLPHEFNLSASPNPFNPTTQINIAVPKAGDVHIAIFDLSGRMVENLYRGQLSTGTYRFAWNAERYASGVYFVRLNTGAKILTRKITLLK